MRGGTFTTKGNGTTTDVSGIAASLGTLEQPATSNAPMQIETYFIVRKLQLNWLRVRRARKITNAVYQQESLLSFQKQAFSNG